MFRSYTVTALAIALLGSLCIVAFCYIVNPYKMYATLPGLKPVNSRSHMLFMRLHTAYDVERVRPSVLVVGNSRSAVLPPQLLEKPGEVAFNASLPGATLPEIRRMIEHAHAINPLKLVLVGIDPQMFREGAPEKVFFDERNRYRKINPSVSDRWHYEYQRLVDNWGSLYSVNAIKAAWGIVFGGGGPDNKEFEILKDGTWDLEGTVASPPRAIYRDVVKKTYERQIADGSKAIKFSELMELLDFTESNGIQTILFIPPLQGLQMNTLEFAQTWEQHRDWHRELVRLVDARNSDTVIYGVEDHPAIVLDPIGSPLHLFRDGVHVTRRAGMEIFTCLAGPCNSDFQPTRLDHHSIDTYLERADALRRQYAQENPADMADARKWLQLE